MKLSRSRVLGACTAVLLAASAALATNMTAVQVYDDASCSGAPLQVVFTPTADCSSVAADADCSLEAQELGIFASAGCTNDPHAFAATAFGGSAYVLVEVHRPDTNCDGLEGVAAYRIDSACHPTVDAGASFQVDWAGGAPSFKLFTDAACSAAPIFELDLAVDSSECVGGSMKLQVADA
ncbi:hypothetical protein PHYPSEUDO_009751 [Phytophthora pseudosyringae]|uniref:Uncharacterized protein n=1 Tax=Phytophthora pseudosyringae TaxID=221518 RepID=A0A8T1VBR3_9STRA|nr:hypothetical protein PHYPSEUDO_009751 [Phytophthora pseudosyringae]